MPRVLLRNRPRCGTIETHKVHGEIRGSMATVSRTFCLPEDVSRALDERGKAEDRPLSRIVAAALRAYIAARASQ